MGNIGRSSISSLAKQLRRDLSADPELGGLDRDNYTIQEIADRAKAVLFDTHYVPLADKPTADHSLEFFVGGYSHHSDIAEVWKLVIANGKCSGPERQFPDDDAAFVLWAGQPEALNRLILGYSQYLPDALLGAGLPQDQMVAVMQDVRLRTGTPLAESPMPTGDAIALADFLVDTTKRYVLFLQGADTVGGATDIATVTRFEGFKWIRRKHHYPRDLNQDTDHV